MATTRATTQQSLPPSTIVYKPHHSVIITVFLLLLLLLVIVLRGGVKLKVKDFELQVSEKAKARTPSRGVKKKSASKERKAR